MEPEDLLPLPPPVFHILVALAPGPAHGYAIMRDVKERADGLRLGPGTLYGSIKRMLEQGLIEESRRRPAPAQDDERRRYYLLTEFGAAVARAEARRLSRLVRLARASGFSPEKA